ncbi:MAG: hypothetical protein K2Q01_11770, partial [Rickettsiales bacterium]|nr:hypothetical protein [Rickettsiales bacterium]
VTFASNFFLKIGSEVVIRIDGSGSSAHAKILTVDGETPEVASHTSAYAKQPEVVLTQQHRPPSALVSLNASVPVNPPAEGEASITVFGTLIKPTPQGSAATPSPLPALPAGTQLTLRVVSVEQPTATPAPTPGQPPQQPLQSQAFPQTIPANPASYAAYTRAAAPAPVTSPQPTAAPLPTNTLTPQTFPTTPPSGPAPAALPSAGPATPAAPQVSQNVTVFPNTEPAPQAQPLQPQAFPQTLQTQSQQASAPLAPPPAAQPLQPSITPAPVTSPPASPVPNPQSPSPTLSAPTITANPQAQLPPLAAQGQYLTAQVLGHETTGEALLSTPVGVVRLQPETVLPKGSTLSLQLLQTTPPALGSVAITSTEGKPLFGPPAPLLELAQPWTSLQQHFGLLTSGTASP